MTRKKNDKGNKSGEPADTDGSLQDELSRETAEGADSIGDVGSNRTLTGSSSWETMPGKDQAPAPLQEKGRRAKKAQDPTSTPNKPSPLNVPWRP